MSMWLTSGLNKPPTRPFPIKSWDQFLMERRANSLYGRPGQLYPCPSCSGRGTIYDPDDPSCPIEGNKMRRRIRCQPCDGTGETHEAVLRGVYDRYVTEAKEEHAKYEQQTALYESGIAKLRAAGLTDDEKKTLGIQF